MLSEVLQRMRSMRPGFSNIFGLFPFGRMGWKRNLKLKAWRRPENFGATLQLGFGQNDIGMGVRDHNGAGTFGNEARH
jgi:hypothetical protein